MRRSYWLFIPILVISILACNITANIPQVQTQVRGVLTNAPTLLGGIETAAASTQPPSNCVSTPTGKGLGFRLEDARSVMLASGQFTFTDSTSNGQPSATASMTSLAAKAFPAIASGFSAEFIGDPCNLAEVKVTLPRTDNEDTVSQALTLMTLLFAGVIPAQMTLELTTWLTQVYPQIPVGGQEQKTIDNISFTLKRDASSMTLDVLPAQ